MQIEDFNWYRRKPTKRRAVRFEPADGQLAGLPPGVAYEKRDLGGGPPVLRYYVENAKGRMDVYPGDWVVYGDRGEVYPVPDEVFHENYEACHD